MTLDPVAEPHARAWRDVANALGVSSGEGLGDAEVRRRLEWFGPNVLREHARKSVHAILAEQFRSLVVVLLAVAATVSFAFREVAEGAAILVVILLNAAIGFFTEIRAVRSMEALREIGQTTTRVRREGRLVEIPADQLVTGMWCSWRAGT